MQGNGQSFDLDLLHFEKLAWDNGYEHVAGVDEVGRGPLAGPVLAVAVILPRTVLLPPVNDSKKLSRKRREALAAELQALAGIRIGMGRISPGVIDEMNILRATHLAMQQALAAIKPPPDYAIVDGRPVPGLPVPATAVVKGDARSASVAAASIIAKVCRDQIMAEYDREFPGYGFAAHQGYGTRAHLAALQALGPSPIHRKSFAPVAKVINGGYFQPEFSFSEPPA
jgi:ribonuclease HII